MESDFFPNKPLEAVSNSTPASASTAKPQLIRTLRVPPAKLCEVLAVNTIHCRAQSKQLGSKSNNLGMATPEHPADQPGQDNQGDNKGGVISIQVAYPSGCEESPIVCDSDDEMADAETTSVGSTIDGHRRKLRPRNNKVCYTQNAYKRRLRSRHRIRSMRYHILSEDEMGESQYKTDDEADNAVEEDDSEESSDECSDMSSSRGGDDDSERAQSEVQDLPTVASVGDRTLLQEYLGIIGKGEMFSEAQGSMNGRAMACLYEAGVAPPVSYKFAMRRLADSCWPQATLGNPPWHSEPVPPQTDQPHLQNYLAYFAERVVLKNQELIPQEGHHTAAIVTWEAIWRGKEMFADMAYMSEMPQTFEKQVDSLLKLVLAHRGGSPKEEK